jgi:hypothetical protein
LFFKLSGLVVRECSENLVELFLRLDPLSLTAELDPQ